MKTVGSEVKVGAKRWFDFVSTVAGHLQYRSFRFKLFLYAQNGDSDVGDFMMVTDLRC